ncbi:MAG: hypothetical protein EXR75_16890, partial [Myxococcales bacterium]|nr:hypothetical protein [Myxococcales bacterium]
MPWTDWRSPLNAVRFALRRTLRFRRGTPTLVDETKEALFDYLTGAERTDAETRERELCRRYQLEALRGRSTRIDYRENLYVLDALEQLMGEHPLGASTAAAQSLRVVDVGSKNFSYAFALERFMSRHASTPPRVVQLTGVELDGFVVYRDFYSRADYAGAYLAQLPDGAARYEVADFCEFPGVFDVVTMFFPFVTESALLSWGLPLGSFAPENILRHALAVAPSGLLLCL